MPALGRGNIDTKPWRGYLKAFDEVMAGNSEARQTMRSEFANNTGRLTRGSGCICGKRMIAQANDGTCLWCGHGSAQPVLEHAYALNQRLNTSVSMDGRAVPGRRRSRMTVTEEECISAARHWEERYGSLPHSSDWQGTVANRGGAPSYSQVKKLFGGWGAFMQAIAQVPREQAA